MWFLVGLRTSNRPELLAPPAIPSSRHPPCAGRPARLVGIGCSRRAGTSVAREVFGLPAVVMEAGPPCPPSARLHLRVSPEIGVWEDVTGYRSATAPGSHRIPCARHSSSRRVQSGRRRMVKRIRVDRRHEPRAGWLIPLDIRRRHAILKPNQHMGAFRFRRDVSCDGCTWRLIGWPPKKPLKTNKCRLQRARIGCLIDGHVRTPTPSRGDGDHSEGWLESRDTGFSNEIQQVPRAGIAASGPSRPETTDRLLNV